MNSGTWHASDFGSPYYCPRDRRKAITAWNGMNYRRSEIANDWARRELHLSVVQVRHFAKLPRHCRRSWSQIVAILVMGLLAPLFASCAVSKSPLSDPGRPKADPRLIGIWRVKGEAWYYHVARAGGKLLDGMMLITVSSHPRDEIESKERKLLVYCTSLGNSSYINMVVEKDNQFDALKKEGWNPTKIEGYFIVKYTLAADALKVQVMDATAVEKAIKNGRIRGTVAKQTNEPNVRAPANALADLIAEPVQAGITDTSDNLRQLVRSDAALFLKKEIILERVK
jgi:hypothetical protein